MKKTHAGRRWLPRYGDMRHRNLARGSRHVLVRAPSRQAQGRSRARLRMHFRQLTGKAGLRDCGTYSFNAITLGSRISKLGLRTIWSYSETMFTRSRNTALTESCQDQRESGK